MPGHVCRQTCRAAGLQSGAQSLLPKVLLGFVLHAKVLVATKRFYLRRSIISKCAFMFLLRIPSRDYFERGARPGDDLLTVLEPYMFPILYITVISPFFAEAWPGNGLLEALAAGSWRTICGRVALWQLDLG